MKVTTEREKTRLFNSEEYGEAVKMKGWGQTNWNWQTREKERHHNRRLNMTAQEVRPSYLARSKSQTVADRNSRQLKDQRSIGENDGEMLSARELMDADFEDEVECQSDNYGRAPPIEV